MKIFYASALFLLSTSYIIGQTTTPPDTSKHVAKQDTINPNMGDVKGQLQQIKADKIKLHSDSIGPDSVGNQPKKSSKVDTVMQNKYGDLLKNDSAYNKRYTLWIPLAEGFGDNLLLSLVDRKILKYSWAMVDGTTWKNNFNAGFPWSGKWDWDQTRFGNDFLGHPYFGNLYYNDARSNGYNFWESAPFALVGSYVWKICGENVTPERNSLIATTVDGISLGEVLYRISSNILDDRTYGTERFFRELLAAMIDPMRGFNRLIQGKTSRHTNKEVYQKEPLNITLYAGLHLVNNHTSAIFSGTTNEMINVQFDYGNPFEVRSRRDPFDFFMLKVETDIGEGRKIIDNINGYGILFGKNAQYDNLALLKGIFLNYDYWDNPTFELSTIALGPGVFSKLPIGKNTNLYTNLQIGLVPFGGTSTGPISDTSQSRDFNFCYGAEAKFETSLSLGKIATIGVAYYYFMLHCINSVGQDEPVTGSLGNNSLGILRPKITLKLYKDLSIGYEYFLYAETHTDAGFPTYTVAQTEQKFFIQFFFEDPQRRGHYN
ncbi:MAG TPA: DUF3943 domain-containing protein [Bacteroidia bacterium]|nr:DUF3943 domain-containing protein [Bacteroidia bacterium]